MRNQGLGSWPARRARRTPEAIAVTGAGRSVTYAEWDRRVAHTAARLRELGVHRGDRVAYLGPNHPAYLETLFACGVLGAIFLPVNTRSTGAEIGYLLADSGARVLIHIGTHDHVLGDLDAAGVRIARLVAEDTGSAPPRVDEPVGLDDPAVLMYTSGTTGRPKGVVLTHGNLTWNCVNVLIESDVATDDVALVAAPLFHAAALGMLCLPTLLKGGRVVLHEKFDPAAVLEAIEAERVTWMFGVPTMYDALAAHPGWAAADLSSLRSLNCGGGSVPHKTIRRYLDRGLRFVQGYGMTEAAPGVLLLDGEHAESKLGSAGVPSFFTDVRIVDGDGREVPPETRGEILVSGPNVMSGYWGRPDDTAAVLREGWFHSGDIATVDEDGYVSIVDRMKDMIVSGGENIYPAEVEHALHAHPAVDRCAVIGVPDERWGEVGKAVVVATGTPPSAGELQEFLRGRIAAYKIPKHFVYVADLPLSGTGKILKRRLRELHGNHCGEQ
ncbi:fatty-acyl-CoA synthase [Nocardia transvalensis]|uniref:Fatty-acyl-CoA synthase n=1 Tax=Nocardia transvalensis TaxID=37333 RepID=A0A7W9PI88_9NOCA|nr:long-chain fatty acid--CoA ligase [Nocardia transvalensis]MBB5916557.1 fatty-acyl-CoA synthase [Nocardia transvalensis]